MSTKDSPSLRSCPFCGGEAHTYRNHLWHVGCERALNGCVTMSAFVTEAEAIEAWNTRAERTCENLANPEDADDLPFRCSECGARSSYGDGTFHIGESFTLKGNRMLADACHAWRYCPNCGARVEEAE